MQIVSLGGNLHEKSKSIFKEKFWKFYQACSAFNKLYEEKMILIAYEGPDQPVEVLWPSQPNGVMLSTVSLPNHPFTFIL